MLSESECVYLGSRREEKERERDEGREVDTHN
jgi:hypothetical protein